MKIRNHRLVDHWLEQSKDVGGPLERLRFIVLHYTAGGSGTASRDYMLKSPTEKGRLAGIDGKIYASAHVIVDRDGSVWQIVPFNRKARHAGRSAWKGLTSLNRYSVGIEMANYGWLNRRGDGTYARLGETSTFAAEEVVVAPMPNGTEVKGWEPYPEPQLAAVETLVRLLLSKYPSITEVLGHQEVAPGRKFDPGPAFPMQRFRNLVDNRGFGALETGPEGGEAPEDRMLTTANLNLREGAGVEFEKLPDSPLLRGTRLVCHDRDGVWVLVSVEQEPEIRGWVHGAFLELVV
jgi:N-acetylmuramoyl-L-alanine amidase